MSTTSWIENWGWGYSFSLKSDRQPIDPYDEFRHLQVKGPLLQPFGAADRQGADIAVALDRSRGRAAEGLDPMALGSLNLAPDGILWDALTPIMQMLIAGRVEFV